MASGDASRALGRHGDYTLTRVGWRDLCRVVAIERAVFPEPVRPAELVRLYLRPQVIYLGAYGNPGHRLAAYYGFECLPGAHGAHVLANATHPDHRRRGLARTLVTLGLDLARARGVRWIVGEVRVSNRAQLSFLKVMGWRVGDRMPGFFGNGEDALFVHRCLM